MWHKGVERPGAVVAIVWQAAAQLAQLHVQADVLRGQRRRGRPRAPADVVRDPLRPNVVERFAIE